MSKLTSLLLLLLPLAVFGAGAPTVFPAAKIKGQKAHLGNPKEPLLVLGPKGISVPVKLPLGRVYVEAKFRYNNKSTLFR